MAVVKHLFVWRSLALANYGSGYIIVMAPSRLAAQDIARSEFETYLRERYSYLDVVDENDVRQLKEMRSKFEDDISREHTNILSGSYLIEGTE